MQHSEASSSLKDESDLLPDTEVKNYVGEDPEKDVGDNNLNPESSDYQDLASESVSRAVSRRISGVAELYEDAAKSTEPLPKMGGGKDYPPMLPERDPYAVAYDGLDDPLFPHNWTTKRKVINSIVVGLSAFSVSLGSAMFSQASAVIMKEYHIGVSTVALGTSLFVFGFASGPIIWGPLSELYGRKIVLVPSIFGFVCFSFMVATAKDIQTIMICRFFAGFIGAAPMVVAPAAMSDIFNVAARGRAVALFSMMIFGGPMLAPIIGGFTVKNSGLGWRWTSYFTGLVGVFSLIGTVFFMDETHHGLILVQKAEALRRRTGNWGIHAAHEEISLSMREIVEKNITRPLVMLFLEPILLLITIYNAFIYGLLYLFLTAVPLIFSGNYKFSQGVAELPYLSMLIGVLLGGICTILLDFRFIKKMTANGGRPIPEERLPPMMLGAVVFTIGLFWLGWTGSYPETIHWIVPTIGAAPIGMGLILLFLPSINYIIDVYLFFAASALAGNTFLRSIFGGAFPLFAHQMFTNMEIKWASTLMGCFSLVMVPVPFLFYKYGAQIRTKSKFAF